MTTDDSKQDNNYAPYAPAKSVLEVIRRHRQTKAPDPLTIPSIQTVGVLKSMAPRTVRAFKFLGLINDEGQHTEAFSRLKQATTEEYPALLAEVIRNAYLPVFTVSDPTIHTVDQIDDAFRLFEPSAQRGSMVSLFLALCEEAEIIDRVPTRQEASRRARPIQRRASRPQQPQAKPRTESRATPPGHDASNDGGTDLAVLSALIQRLPRGRVWTSDARQRWLTAFQANIDLIVETREQLPDDGPQQNDGEGEKATSH